MTHEPLTDEQIDELKERLYRPNTRGPRDGFVTALDRFTDLKPENLPRPPRFRFPADPLDRRAKDYPTDYHERIQS